MHWHTVDYLKEDGPARGRLVNRGFWLSGIPRPLIWCRLLGHRPVVDGYGPHRPGLDAARWVCCDRCGVRPDPQGNLDPDQWDVGQRYTGTFDGALVVRDRPNSREPSAAKRPLVRVHGSPGSWPRRSEGEVGGQFVIGKTFGVFEAEVKVGNAGSEQTLAAHLRIWPIGALYLHTERFGTWLQRRLNPTGYDSRLISLAVGDWQVRWKLWARRDHYSRTDPWWMHGSISLNPVEQLLGPKYYSYENVGEPVTATVRMPHGDDHQVTLQLQSRTFGRRRGRKTVGWDADWNCEGGIATKPGDRGGVWGSGVEVPDDAVKAGDWVSAAVAAIAQRLTADRVRYGFQKRTAPEVTR
ncbi:hypothetical protein ABT340_39525 [Streptosporangium sp. NPDC000239]|uniref:hypothetical protein n=1 Tax=Streptosporangium sp. NPDC000239 TaxID=3154248 RepID=UPI00331B1E1C